MARAVECENKKKKKKKEKSELVWRKAKWVSFSIGSNIDII